MTLVAGACAAWPQAVSFGVKGGVPIGDLNANRDESRPYIVGPSVEIRLPANFAIEIDALYRRVGNSLAYPTPWGAVFNRDRGNSWQFPFLGKYYFRSASEGWQPFVGTGWSLRETWVHSDGSSPQAYHFDYRDRLDVGAVASAGVRFRKGRFAFAPEVRYTRWAGANFERNARNEAGILFGISF